MTLKLRGLRNYCLAYGVFQTPKGNTSSTVTIDVTVVHDGVTQPVCIMWGDKDHVAPAEVLDAYRVVPSRQGNVEVHIFPGILHGYMMPDHTKAYDATTRAFSMARALAILEGLRGEALRQAS